MATQKLDYTITLNSIRCIDEADGWELGEPYLWTISFQIGGDEIQQSIENLSRLEGTPIFAFGQGSHGNIGGCIDAGDIRLIPGAVGTFCSGIRPIEIRLLGNHIAIPGFIGLVTVLMEEENLSDGEAETGHQALNQLVVERINSFLSKLNLLDIYLEASKLTDGTISIEEAFAMIFKSKIERAIYQLADDKQREIKKAIYKGQNIFRNPWGWIGTDIFVGSKMSLFSTEELEGMRNEIELRADFDEGDGEYEVTGKFTLSRPMIPVAVLPSGNDRTEHQAISTAYS